MSGARKRSRSRKATRSRMAANSASTSGEALAAPRLSSMPCAAASASMPTTTAVLSTMSARRRAAKVAIDTWSSWLAEVGRLSTLAGCASDLFSEASAAAVTCAIMKPELSAAIAHQERRQARQAGVEQQRDAALGDGADLGDRQRQDVGREGHRLGVEVAAGDHVAGVGEHQRVVRHGVGLDHAARARRAPGCRGRRPSPAARSAASTGPARGRSRRATARSRCRRAARAPRAATAIWPGWPRAAWMRASKGLIEPWIASSDSAPAISAGGEHVLGAEQAGQRQRGRHLRAVEQRQAFLRAEHEGREADARASLRRRRSRVAVGRRGLAFADQHAGQVRQRRQVARGADRALARNARQHAGIEQRAAARRPAPAARPSGRAPGSPPWSRAPAAPPPPPAARRCRRCATARGCAAARPGARAGMCVCASLPKPVLMP